MYYIVESVKEYRDTESVMNESPYLSFDHCIILMICIIFFLVFVIQMTIFDFYKKPSIYELELLNEFKKTGNGGACTDAAPQDSTCTSSTNTPEETTSGGDKKRSMIYQDAIIVLLYTNILYYASSYLSDVGMIFITIVFGICVVFYRNSYRLLFSPKTF